MDAEAVVRELCEAFSRTDVAELLGYFARDAVYEKIPVSYTHLTLPTICSV